jgi:hypothetical protein
MFVTHLFSLPFTGLNATKILSHELEATQNMTVIGIAVSCIFVVFEVI